MTHFFVFGTFPEISLAELHWSIQRFGAAKITHADRWGAIVEGVPDDAVMALFQQLGGCTRVGRVVGQHIRRSALEPTLAALVSGLSSDRIHFGLSALGGSIPSKQIQGIGITIKRSLKDQGRPSRFVVSRDPVLSSVVITKNHLLEKGAEFMILGRAFNDLTIAQTLAVQEFEAWGDRDFGRPARDARRGMLPPKLARMMINLAKVQSTNYKLPTVLDPFCGSGTVLMEARQLGYSVIGSDVSAQAVEDTRQNLAWFCSNAKLPITNYQLHVSDVRHLTQKIPPHSIDVIVTEPDLGLPQSKMITKPEDIRAQRQRLNPLYLQAVEVFFSVLKPGARAVISWPCWPMANRKGIVYAISDLDAIRKQGFEIVPPVPSTLAKSVPQQRFHYRHSLLYGRSDQFVWREIMILEKSQSEGGRV